MAFTSGSLLRLITLASHAHLGKAIKTLRIDTRRLDQPRRLGRRSHKHDPSFLKTLNFAMQQDHWLHVHFEHNKDDQAVLSYLKAYDEQQSFDASGLDVELLASALRKLVNLQAIELQSTSTRGVFHEPDFRSDCAETDHRRELYKRRYQTSPRKALCKLGAALESVQRTIKLDEFSAALQTGGLFDLGPVDMDAFGVNGALGKALLQIKRLRLRSGLCVWDGIQKAPAGYGQSRPLQC